MPLPSIDINNPNVFKAVVCDFPSDKEIQDVVYAGKTLVVASRLEDDEINPAFITQWTALIRIVLRNLVQKRIALDIATVPSHLGYISLAEQLVKGVVESIDDRTLGLFPHQKDSVFEVLKRNVEYFVYYFLVLQDDLQLDNAVLRDTLHNTAVCGPGLFVTFSKQVVGLYSKEGFYFTLAQCRTDIARQLAENFIQKNVIRDGMAMHAHIGFEECARKNGFHLLTSSEHTVQDDFLSLLGMQDPSSPIYTWFCAEFLKRYRTEAIPYLAQTLKNVIYRTFNQYAKRDPNSGETRLNNDGYLAFFEDVNGFFSDLNFPMGTIIQSTSSDESDDLDNAEVFFTLNSTGMKHIDVLVTAYCLHLGILDTAGVALLPFSAEGGIETRLCSIELSSEKLALLFEQHTTRSLDGHIESTSFSLSNKGIVYLSTHYFGCEEQSLVPMDFTLGEMVKQGNHEECVELIIDATPFPLIRELIFNDMFEKVAPFSEHDDFYRHVFQSFLDALIDRLNNKNIDFDFYDAFSCWLNRIERVEDDFIRDCLSEFFSSVHQDLLKKCLFELCGDFASYPEQTSIGHVLLFFIERRNASFFVIDQKTRDNFPDGLPSEKLISVYLANPQNPLLLRVCDQLASEPSIAMQWLQVNPVSPNTCYFDFLFVSLQGQGSLFVSLFVKVAMTVPKTYWHQVLSADPYVITPLLFLVNKLHFLNPENQSIVIDLIGEIVQDYMEASFSGEMDPTSPSPMETLLTICFSEWSNQTACNLFFFLYDHHLMCQLESVREDDEFEFYLKKMSHLHNMIYSLPVPSHFQSELFQNVFHRVVIFFDTHGGLLPGSHFLRFADFLLDNILTIVVATSVSNAIHFEMLERYVTAVIKYHDRMPLQLERLVDQLSEEKWVGLFHSMQRNQRESITVFGLMPQNTNEYCSMSEILNIGKNAPRGAVGRTLLEMGVDPAQSGDNKPTLFEILVRKYSPALLEEEGERVCESSVLTP